MRPNRGALSVYLPTARIVSDTGDLDPYLPARAHRVHPGPVHGRRPFAAPHGGVQCHDRTL